MNHKHYVILHVLFQLMFFVWYTECADWSEIEIINLIMVDSDSPVEVMCKDMKVLGNDVTKSLAFHELLTFRCKGLLPGNISCKCTVQWGNNVYTFSAYVTRRDAKLCGKSCKWHLTINGPNLVDKSSGINKPIILKSYTWAEARVLKHTRMNDCLIFKHR